MLVRGGVERVIEDHLDRDEIEYMTIDQITDSDGFMGLTKVLGEVVYFEKPPQTVKVNLKNGSKYSTVTKDANYEYMFILRDCKTGSGFILFVKPGQVGVLLAVQKTVWLGCTVALFDAVCTGYYTSLPAFTTKHLILPLNGLRGHVVRIGSEKIILSVETPFSTKHSISGFQVFHGSRVTDLELTGVYFEDSCKRWGCDGNHEGTKCSSPTNLGCYGKLVMCGFVNIRSLQVGKGSFRLRSTARLFISEEIFESGVMPDVPMYIVNLKVRKSIEFYMAQGLYFYVGGWYNARIDPELVDSADVKQHVTILRLSKRYRSDDDDETYDRNIEDIIRENPNRIELSDGSSFIPSVRNPSSATSSLMGRPPPRFSGRSSRRSGSRSRSPSTGHSRDLNRSPSRSSRRSHRSRSRRSSSRHGNYRSGSREHGRTASGAAGGSNHHRTSSNQNDTANRTSRDDDGTGGSYHHRTSSNRNDTPNRTSIDDDGKNKSARKRDSGDMNAAGSSGLQWESTGFQWKPIHAAGRRVSDDSVTVPVSMDSSGFGSFGNFSINARKRLTNGEIINDAVRNGFQYIPLKKIHNQENETELEKMRKAKEKFDAEDHAHLLPEVMKAREKHLRAEIEKAAKSKIPGAKELAEKSLSDFVKNVKSKVPKRLLEETANTSSIVSDFGRYSSSIIRKSTMTTFISDIPRRIHLDPEFVQSSSFGGIECTLSTEVRRFLHVESTKGIQDSIDNFRKRMRGSYRKYDVI
jgi:hypothetical protein